MREIKTLLDTFTDVSFDLENENAKKVIRKVAEFYKNDKFPYGKPQTDEVARGSGNREYGCRRLREKLPNVRESLFLEPGIPIV